MKKEQLVAIIEGLAVGQEVKVKSSTFTFGLTVKEQFDEEVVIFGGYGTHYSIWGLDVHNEDEIADEIIKHIGQYDSEVKGQKWVSLEECTLVTN